MMEIKDRGKYVSMSPAVFLRLSSQHFRDFLVSRNLRPIRQMSRSVYQSEEYLFIYYTGFFQLAVKTLDEYSYY